MGREALRVGIIKDIGFTIVVVQEAESASGCCFLAGRSYAGGESMLSRQAFNNLSPFKTIQLTLWEAGSAREEASQITKIQRSH